MITLHQMLGSSSTLGPTLSTNFFESRTWTAPQDGIVIVRGMGAGGGGVGAAATATGGPAGLGVATAIQAVNLGSQLVTAAANEPASELG